MARLGRGFPNTYRRTTTTSRLPATYYVSAVGSNANDGLTSGTPWQTIAKVNSITLFPGDTVQFRGGDTFTGQVVPGASGTAAKPIVYRSYGTGRATINNTTADAFAFVNRGGLEVRDLIVTGGTTSFSNGSAGVDGYATTGNGKFAHIVVDNCDISGFQHGVIIGGDTTAEGFTDVTINNCDLHGNKNDGVAIWGGAGGTAWSNGTVTITNVRAYSNLGDSADVNPTGSGIVMGSTNVALIDQCTAHDNGGSNNPAGGPVGIWCYDSTLVVIQRCLSHSNKTAGSTDGGGFDLDINVSNSTVQYCFAYNNDGPGYLFFASGTSVFTGNVLRYNLGWGNVRNTSLPPATYGEMLIGGTVASSAVYGNTFYSKDNASNNISALVINATPTGVTVRNNVLRSQTAATVQTGSAWATSAALMQGNDYYRSAGISIKWGATTYTSLATWRAAVAGQEMVSAANVGATVDPVFVDGVTTPVVTDATTMTSYTGLQLQGSSTLITTGLDMNGTFGVDPGTRDFWNGTLSVPLSVGAFEGTVGTSANADCGTGTGAAFDPYIAVVGVATGTGAANDATTTEVFGVDCGTGTGAANDATVVAVFGVDCGAGTGAANDATTTEVFGVDCGTGTGTAYDPYVATVVVATGAGAANDATTTAVFIPAEGAGTGAANDATVSTASSASAPADCGTGTGAALDPYIAAVDCATGTGSAFDPYIAVVDCATGTGAANDATVSTLAATSASADCGTGTGTAYDPYIAAVVLASGSGAALDAVGTPAYAVDCATPSGAALDAVGAPAYAVDCATGTGAAFDATVGTTSSGSASPDCGIGTGAALDPYVATVIVATGTGAALDATVTTATAPAPAEAAGIGAAFDATTTAVFIPAEGAGTGAAFDATVSTIPTANAPADCATGTGTAYDPYVAAVVVATGTGAAFDATTQNAHDAAADCATGTGAAPDPYVSTVVVAAGSGAANDATIQVFVSAGNASGVSEPLVFATVSIGVFADLALGIWEALDATTPNAIIRDLELVLGPPELGWHIGAPTIRWYAVDSPEVRWRTSDAAARWQIGEPEPRWRIGSAGT